MDLAWADPRDERRGHGCVWVERGILAARDLVPRASIRERWMGWGAGSVGWLVTAGSASADSLSHACGPRRHLAFNGIVVGHGLDGMGGHGWVLMCVGPVGGVARCGARVAALACTTLSPPPPSPWFSECWLPMSSDCPHGCTGCWRAWGWRRWSFREARARRGCFLRPAASARGCWLRTWIAAGHGTRPR